VRLPAAWYRLATLVGRGSTTKFRTLETGALVYRDYVEVERLN
jgi:hypothetical protein